MDYGYVARDFLNSINRKKPVPKDIYQNIYFNTTKKTWDCGLCRKCFKAKKDIEQHLNSGTHEAIRFSCSECGKGFASLGALTLHTEQAGHLHMNVRLISDAEPISTRFRNDISQVYGEFRSQLPTQSHFYRGSTNSDRFDMNYDLPHQSSMNIYKQPDHHLYNAIDIKNQSLLMYRMCIMGYTERFSMEAGCCYTLSEAQNGHITGQDAYVIYQFYPCSMQPEYQALCDGLAQALQCGVRNLVVYTSNELLYRHWHSGAVPSFFQSSYRVVAPLIINTKRLCKEFRNVNIQLISKAALEEEEKLAKNAFLALKTGLGSPYFGDLSGTTEESSANGSSANDSYL